MGGWVRAPIPTEGAVTQQFQTARNWSCHSNALLVSSCHQKTKEIDTREKQKATTWG